MTLKKIMYVKKLGGYYGVTAFALYPSQYMLGDSHGQSSQSYLNALADWLAKGILSSRSLSRTLISAEPLLSPKIKYGLGLKARRSSLPARILDDLKICRTRAYYTAHSETYRAAKMKDMEESEELGKLFIEEELLPKLNELDSEGFINEVINMFSEDRGLPSLNVVYAGIDRVIKCKPDALLLLSVGLNIHKITALNIEVSETNTQTLLTKKHVIPRLVLYMASTTLYYGVPSASLYISLSPSSKPPAILFINIKGNLVQVERLLDEVKELLDMEEPPKPFRITYCHHCVYSRVCWFR